MDDHNWEYSGPSAIIDNFNNFRHYILNISKLVFAQVFICTKCGSKKIMKDTELWEFHKPNEQDFTTYIISCNTIIMEQVLK